MVLPLAPNISRMLRPKMRKKAVRTTATVIRAVVQLPRMFSASSFLPLPSIMDALGAPPMLTRAAKAEIAMITGKVTPTPKRMGAFAGQMADIHTVHHVIQHVDDLGCNGRQSQLKKKFSHASRAQVHLFCFFVLLHIIHNPFVFQK